LKENHTLLGIHIRGNAAIVDSLGFIQPKPDKSTQPS